MSFDESESVERTDLIMPTGSLNVVLNFADPQFLVNSEGALEKLPDILITGQLDKVWKLQYGANLNQIGLILKPVGFFKLFQVPGALFAGTFIDGGEAPWNLTGLYSSLEQTRDFDTSFRIVENYLEEVTKSRDSLELLNKMISSIESAKGNMTMEELASLYNKSISAIERYFKKMIGMTPKAYANIVKFRTAMKEMDESKGMLDYYYDQSHFIKSCKKYTGKTPSELMKSNQEISLSYMLEQG